MDVNARDAAAEVFGDETVIVNLATGRYYALDAAGTEVWDLLASRAGFDGTVAAVAAAHGVPEPAVRSVLAPFVRLLIEEELVLGVPPSEAEVQAEATNGHGTLEPPVMEIFTDMSELLAADPIHDIDLDGTGWPRAPERRSA